MTTTQTQKFSDVPTRGRRECRSCHKYISVRASECPACGAGVSGAKPPPKAAAAALPAPVSQSAGRGKKKCEGCMAYTGVRSLVCKSCGKPFVSLEKVRAVMAVPSPSRPLTTPEPEAATKEVAAEPSASSYDRFRQVNVVEGYFAFTSQNGLHPSGIYTGLDQARIARGHYPERHESIEMTLYRCETHELAGTIRHDVVRDGERRIEIYG